MKVPDFLIRNILAAPVAVALTFTATAQTPQGNNPQGGTDRDRQQETSTTESRQRTAPGSESGGMLSRNDAKFLHEAAQGGMMEVQLAKMAQEKATNEQVKQFAEQLEQDHTKANEQLKELASQKQVDLPTDLDSKHQKHINRLEKLSGEQFDRAYMQLMVEDHKKDVNKFKKHAERAMDSDVKQFAASTVPVLEKHLEQAQELRAEVRGTGTKARSADTDVHQEHGQSPATRGPADDDAGTPRTPQPQPRNQGNPTPEP